MANKYICGNIYRNCKSPYENEEDQFISWINIDNRGINNSKGIKAFSYLNKKRDFDNLDMPASIVIVHSEVKTQSNNPWKNKIYEDKIEYCGDCKKPGIDPSKVSGNSELINILNNMSLENLDLIPPILYFYQNKSGYVYFKGVYYIKEKSIYEDILENKDVIKNYIYTLIKVNLDIVDIDWIKSRALAKNLEELTHNAPKEWTESLKDYLSREQEEIYNNEDNINFLIKEDIYELEILEGNKVLKEHFRRERNTTIIKLAKDKFKNENGKLYCEICKFDFVKVYGEIGEDFMEGHHKVPVSEADGNRKTKISDIIMVCSNCHRMLHRKNPCLEKEELVERINRNK